MFVRTTDSSFTLANFMRTHLYSSLASLKMGMRILIEEEGASIDSITGHGGFFKVTNVGLRIMATAMGVPVTVMATAGEGGPWGIAVLAAYMMNNQGSTLADYLSESVFTDSERTTVAPEDSDIEGFGAFMQRYKAGLDIERKAVESI